MIQNVNSKLKRESLFCFVGSFGSLFHLHNLAASVGTAKSADAVRKGSLAAFRAGVEIRFFEGKMRGAAAFVRRSASMTGKTHIISL